MPRQDLGTALPFVALFPHWIELPRQTILPIMCLQGLPWYQLQLSECTGSLMEHFLKNPQMFIFLKKTYRKRRESWKIKI